LLIDSRCHRGETLLRIADPGDTARWERETRHLRPDRDRFGPSRGEGRCEGGVLRQEGCARRAGSELWRGRGRRATRWAASIAGTSIGPGLPLGPRATTRI